MTLFAMYCIIAVLAKEIYSLKVNKTDLEPIDAKNDIILEKGNIYKRTLRQTFGGYGIGVGHPYISERAPLPSK